MDDENNSKIVETNKDTIISNQKVTYNLQKVGDIFVIEDCFFEENSNELQPS